MLLCERTESTQSGSAWISVTITVSPRYAAVPQEPTASPISIPSIAWL